MTTEQLPVKTEQPQLITKQPSVTMEQPPSSVQLEQPPSVTKEQLPPSEQPQLITKQPSATKDQPSPSEQPPVDEEMMEVEETGGTSLEEKVMKILSSPALLTSLAETAQKESSQASGDPHTATMEVDSHEEDGE